MALLKNTVMATHVEQRRYQLQEPHMYRDLEA